MFWSVFNNSPCLRKSLFLLALYLLCAGWACMQGTYRQGAGRHGGWDEGGGRGGWIRICPEGEASGTCQWIRGEHEGERDTKEVARHWA